MSSGNTTAPAAAGLRSFDIGPDVVLWIKIRKVPGGPKRVFFETESGGTKSYGQFLASDGNAVAWMRKLFVAFQGGGTVTYTITNNDDVDFGWNVGINPPGVGESQVFPAPTHKEVTVLA